MEWCRDPFWARYRYEQVSNQLAVQGRRLVVPITFWLVRSAAANEDGSCTFPDDEETPSLAAWHKSIADSMGAAAAVYGPWGIGFDYRFRMITVPSTYPGRIEPSKM